jgi:PAS domain S-box-containing protein
MKIKSNKYLSEIHDDNTLIDNSTIKIHIKYLFSLVGFGIGSIFSLISIVFEEDNLNINSAHSHLPHLTVPFLFGIIGAVIGYIYGKRRHNKAIAVHELFLSQQTLNLIFDNLPVLISYIDSDLRFQYINKTHENWLGLSLDDVEGKYIKDIVGKKTFEVISLNLKKANEGETINFENERNYNGKKRFSQSTIIPHLGLDKKVLGFITIVTDISELRKRENKIKHQKDELAELNATKDKFFSIISHDLKSPFTTLLGFSELLFNEYDTFDEKTRKEFIELIYKSSQNNFKLLENLLTWSLTQIGKIKFNPSQVNLKALVDENIDLINQAALGKGIRLESQINHDIIIDTDNDLINTVIRNLISNAIKFTPKDGKVTISANLVSETQPNEYLELSIKDTGLGIAPENLGKLFKIGKSVSRTGTEGELGTGLGLMLCKEFIEKCGGKIWVESEVGNGSVFHFTLPNSQQLNGKIFA